MSQELQSRESGRSSEVGFMLASAAVPRSFQKSLLPRETTDQGIITGLNMVMAFAIGTAMQSVIDKTANTAEKVTSSKGINLKQDDLSLMTSIVALGLGIGAQKIFEQKDGEKLARSSARTMGYWLTNVAAAGLIAGSLEKTVMAAAGTTNDHTAIKRRQFLLPLVVPVGALVAIARDHVIYRNDVVEQEVKDVISPVKSVGIGVAVASVLGLISFAERKTAHAVDGLVEEKAPYFKNSWLPFGRAVSLGVIGLSLYATVHRLYKKIENGADKLEENFSAVPNTPYVSGSDASAVDWATLTLQGRRHIDGRVPKAKISQVMQTTNAKTYEPIRVFIGLDSAPTEIERVTLAIDELKRTGAFERETIVVISPTGTGYVNYVFSESVEYMSGGNCASVTIQYSKRPSPMSLDHVPEGRDQLRMLVMGINRELKKMPLKKRPRIVLFGESLGAWTSQEAFSGGGTDLMDAYNIDRAFWIGTPAGSNWAKQVLLQERYDTIAGQVDEFNDFGQYKKLTTNAKKNLKFVLCTHDDDPIPKFGVSLLVQSPPWLKHGIERAPTIPKNNHYRTPLTFIQTMVDMKNALKPIPGQFVSVGHDYRADIADFVRAVYGFKITEKQMQAINLALRESDIVRGKTQG
jgi:uncharacterized membrane protein